MGKIKLTREEKAIEAAALRGEYVPVSKEKHDEIVAILNARKKDAVLNIRINGQDLRNLKEKARRYGVKYQTFISEILHRVAQA